VDPKQAPSPDLIRGATFNIVTKAMTVKEAENGRRSLHCTASSTVEDLHGDTMTDECVRDMAAQAKSKGMTIFLNHRYNVPEDVFGVTQDSAVTSRAQDSEGTAIWDLDLDIDLAGTNPRVPKTWELIKDDQVKLGVSIGAMIVDWDYKDEKQGWWGGLVIKKVDLLEASIVGIPANQRSWVQNAVAAIKAFDRDLKREKTMDADDTTPQSPLTTEAQRLALVNGIPPAAAVTVASVEPKAAEATPDAAAQPEAEAETTDEPAGDGTPEGDGSAAAESSGEPSSTEQPTETASATEPQPEIHNAQELGLIEATVTTLEAAITEIRAKDATITSLNERVSELERERDAATQLAEAASELIEKIATTPLGRKTQIREGVNTFHDVATKVWGPEIAAVLETTP
jgi:hypothetical protein